MFLGKKSKLQAQEEKIKVLENEIERLKRSLGSETGYDHPLFIIKKGCELGNLGLWIKPLEKEIIELTETACAILKYNGSKSLNFKEFLSFLHPDDSYLFDKTIRSLSLDDPNFEIDFRVVVIENDNREIRFCASKGTLLLNDLDKRLYAVGTITDNSHQEKTKKELAKAIERAEEAERLKNTLLINISNEIRTPMNAIIGFSELLNIGNPDFEKRKEYSKTIRNQGNLLLKFIDDITELIKFESGKVTIARTQCNLNILLKEILINANQLKQVLNKESLETRLSAPDSKGLIMYTDPGRLQQVIINLINNAVKFTEKGFIEFGYRMPQEGKIEFFVKDTGIGLSKEQQKNIFNRFTEQESLTRKYEGSGLGLTLSKHLIRLLGGKIWVESEPGKGAVFQFTIPYTPLQDGIQDYVSADEEHLPVFLWKDKVILVVEDDDVNFKFLEAILQDSATQILHAKNGSQAVELCKSISKIDLVLMDIKMPEMDGFEATKQIRQFNKKLPIIAQTAFAQEIDPEKCLLVGCNDSITKPFDIKEFLEKINVYLRE